jgi:hypothetical protein
MMSEQMLVSTRKGLFIYVRRGADWVIEHYRFPGQNVTLAACDPRNDAIYAALNLGHFGVKLHRSSDGGASWQELAVPVYPAGEQIVFGDGKPPQPASLKMIWSLASGSAAQPGRLWAGTLPGGLFRSDDDGANWELVRSLWDRPERQKWGGGGYDWPGIHSICIDPRDANIIRVAVSTGGIWQTNDGGSTWNLAATGLRAEYMPPALQFEPVHQDVHRLVQCPAAPDHLWLQHHNGIFRSDDGSANWKEIAGVKPSVFGFAVAVHPREPNTAWFVPAIKDEFRMPVDGQMAVTRTRDGGQSFDVLRRGLPQEHCYDLVYRHALDVDAAGNRLVIGSTTGGLWLSDDQGDSWRNLSSHLPPIHAVQFV